MSKEEAEREKQSHDGRDGSFGVHRGLSRTSADRSMNQAGPQVSKAGASEDVVHDRMLGAVRSPSPDKANGATGKTLPVVEEDGEANSREDSMHNEKPDGATSRKTTALLSDAR